MITMRMEAFSDGVLAIVITMMVPEIKVPHDTGWMGQNHRAVAPAVLYGRIIALQASDSVLRQAVGRDWKGHTSLTLCLV